MFQIVSYTYDANGNRVTQTDSSGTSTFGYDALNRLSQAAYPGTYGTWSWAYDAVGNRTSQTINTDQTFYTYDANNRLTHAGAVVYSYDANGNLTSTSAGQSFEYDPFNRMKTAASAGGTATYTYNGDGLKVQRVGPDGATRYYYDGIRPIWETDGAGAMTAELDRDIFGNLLSRAEPAMRRYYHTDGLGSTIALTDEAGATAASMLYDAWGNVRASSGSGHGKYRFTGAELDTASDLYHMGARFYDPSIGRWLSEDSVRNPFEPISLNFYAYVANNPLVMIDPAGTREDYQVGGGSCDAACQDASRKEERAREVWDALDSMGFRVDLDTIRNALSLAEAHTDLSALGPDVLAAVVVAIVQTSKTPGVASGNKLAYRIAGALLVVLGAGVIIAGPGLAVYLEGPWVLVDPGVLALLGAGSILVLIGARMIGCGCGP